MLRSYRGQQDGGIRIAYSSGGFIRNVINMAKQNAYISFRNRCMQESMKSRERTCLLLSDGRGDIGIGTCDRVVAPEPLSPDFCALQ